MVTEESDSRGDAFLTVLTRDWQAAADPAVEAGARVCVMRTAPVTDRANPLLKLQVPVFKAFLGARLGDGRQYFPVISLHDWIGAAVHLLEHPSASGVFNMCAPDTPTNAEYTRAFAHAVSRPAFLVAPKPLLKAAAGPMAPEMLNSINLRPAALEEAGYRFRDRTVDQVVAAATASVTSSTSHAPDTWRSEITRVDGRSRGRRIRTPRPTAWAPTTRSVTSSVTRLGAQDRSEAVSTCVRRPVTRSPRAAYAASIARSWRPVREARV